jgi:hypothetical protein
VRRFDSRVASSDAEALAGQPAPPQPNENTLSARLANVLNAALAPEQFQLFDDLYEIPAC